MKNNMTSKLFEAASSVNKGAYELSKETLIESQRIVEEKSDEEIRRQLKGSKFCPRCGRRYNDYPAISRYDNKTEICPDCGVEEAMINFTGGHLSDPHVYDEEVKEEINESADSDIVTIYLEINTDYDEERYRESGHSGFMPISYVTRNFKRDIAKALGHNNFKLKCVSERGPHGWPVYFVTGSVEDMKKVCGRFTTDDFESSIVDDSIRDFYNKNKDRDLSPRFVSSEEINESAELTAKVLYHNEDGTRDYIAGKLSDGRYFLISQQEEIIVSDKDLPSLAKRDMDDYRYDEDGDKEFIEALENGTDLDKNSDLAKVIIKASRKYLDDGGYLLSESADNISSEDKKKEIEDNKKELKEEEEKLQDKTKIVNTNKAKRKIEELKKLNATFEEKIIHYQKIIDTDGKRIILGGIIFMIYNKEILALFGGNYDKYKEFSSFYTLHWELIKHALHNGYNKYNFYGISGDFNNKNDELYGLYECKKGFGGQVEEYIGEFDLIINKFMYFIYKKSFTIYKKLKK